jgi:tRNA 5-methylaminomethyl-2-thiouridine biosynthesis bifunctional protein
MQPTTRHGSRAIARTACLRPWSQAGRCLVLGAGLAGAAAASLARRGWEVTVLDAAAEPAAGASGLPAGLFCPHISPDDSVLSRLSRSGVRTTLQNLQQLSQAQKLHPAQDWAHGGVLEHDLNEPSHLPRSWLQPGSETSPWGLHWSAPALPAQLAAAKLPADSHAVWHEQAGWVRPAQLVRAAASPRDSLAGPCRASRLVRDEVRNIWQVLDAQGQTLAEAPCWCWPWARTPSPCCKPAAWQQGMGAASHTRPGQRGRA